MTTNISRLKKDLERLTRQGDLLQIAMKKELSGVEFVDDIRERLGKEHADKLLTLLPPFNSAYEGWYSESLALLRQLLPDRVGNFVSLYEKPKGRKELQWGNYVMQDYLQGLRATFMGEEKVGPRAAATQFDQQVAIVKAAGARFESSLFEIRQLVQADLFDSEIDAARELLKHKFLRAAGAVAGVVLEKHLHQVCKDHAITVTKKHPGIAVLNELLKTNSVIDVPQWRHISLLGDIRNICDHSKQVEPTAEQVTDLVDGTAKVLKTVA